MHCALSKGGNIGDFHKNSLMREQFKVHFYKHCKEAGREVYPVEKWKVRLTESRGNTSVPKCRKSSALKLCFLSFQLSHLI